MCFSANLFWISKTEYFRRNQVFAGNTRFWKQGKFYSNLRCIAAHFPSKQNDLSNLLFFYPKTHSLSVSLSIWSCLFGHVFRCVCVSVFLEVSFLLRILVIYLDFLGVLQVTKGCFTISKWKYWIIWFSYRWKNIEYDRLYIVINKKTK